MTHADISTARADALTVGTHVVASFPCGQRAAAQPRDAAMPVVPAPDDL